MIKITSSTVSLSFIFYLYFFIFRQSFDLYWNPISHISLNKMAELEEGTMKITRPVASDRFQDMFWLSRACNLRTVDVPDLPDDLLHRTISEVFLPNCLFALRQVLEKDAWQLIWQAICQSPSTFTFLTKSVRRRVKISFPWRKALNSVPCCSFNEM